MFRRLVFSAALAAAPLAQAANDAQRTAALIDGVVFFGILFALLIYAGAMRIRDARAGLSEEEKKARLKKRLPFVMGGFFAACIYIALRV
jgi:hypothetical protein